MGKLASPVLFVTLMKVQIKFHSNIRKILPEEKAQTIFLNGDDILLLLTDSECSIPVPATKTQHSVERPARVTKNKTENLLLSRFSSASIFKDWKYKMVKKGMQYSRVFLLWKTWSKGTENFN